MAVGKCQRVKGADMKDWPGEPDMAYNQVQASGPAQSAVDAPVENVIFDFGQVLIDLDPEPVLLSEYSKDLTDRFFDNSCSGYCDASDAMDEGRTQAEALDMVRDRHGEQWACMLGYYFEHFDDCVVGQVSGMAELVADLKRAGIGVWGAFELGSGNVPDSQRPLHSARVERCRGLRICEDAQTIS
jgi:hypothetical protein